MSIHYSLNHRINILLSKSSILAKLSGQTRMIRTYIGSSGQISQKPFSVNPDNPALSQIIQPSVPRPLWSSLDDPAVARIIRPLRPKPSSQVWMIRPYPGSSDYIDQNRTE